MIAIDKPLTRAWQDHVERSLDGFQLPHSPLNRVSSSRISAEDGWLLTGIGANYLYGALANDVDSQVTGVLAGKAALYSVVVSQLVLKSLTGRLRPVDSLSTESSGGGRTTNPWDFGHIHSPHLGSGGPASSMPSFHFTMFFAVATVYSEAHGGALWPYGVAALGLASNVRGHHHWVSDMAAGALVGTAIGRVVTDGRFDGSGRLTVTPTLPSGALGIGVRYAF